MATYAPVLVAEDDPNDLFLLQRAFRKAGVHNPLFAVGDGEQAMAYLSGEGIYGDRHQYPLPRVVLTDLNMPKATGFDLLAWVKQSLPDAPPTIVLSSSNQEQDRKRALQLGATAYWVKPCDFDDLVKLAEQLQKSWLTRESATR